MNELSNFGCPRGCGVDLRLAERNGVEIDYCPKCRGVWLDRGELDKILDRATEMSFAAPATAAAPPIPQTPYSGAPGYRGYDDDDDDDHYKRHDRRKKRKNWLGEIFDFD